MDKVIKKVELTLPKEIKVIEDKRSKAKSIWLSFRFLNGDQAAIIITKLAPKEWKASEEVESIVINFK